MFIRAEPLNLYILQAFKVHSFNSIFVLLNNFFLNQKLIKVFVAYMGCVYKIRAEGVKVMQLRHTDDDVNVEKLRQVRLHSINLLPKMHLYDLNCED